MDAALGLSQTPKRELKLLFTKPYAHDQAVVVVRGSKSSIKDWDDLAGKRVVTVKGMAIEKELRQAIDDGQLLIAKNDEQALSMLAKGKADAYAGLLIPFNNAQRALHIPGLRIAVARDSESGAMRIGVPKTRPELFNIIRKGLNAIPKASLNVIKSRWLYAFDKLPVVNQDIILTQEEKDWLEKRTTPVKAGAEMDWPPFDFVKDGRGYRLLQRFIAAGLPKGRNACGVRQRLFLVRGACAVLCRRDRYPALYYENGERKRRMFITSSYASNPTVLVVKNSSSHSSRLTDLYGKKVAVVEGFATADALKERCPAIKQVVVRSVLEGLKAVSFDKADAFIGSLGVITYVLSENILSNLKITGEVWLKTLDETRLHMATAKNQPILFSLLQKGLDAVTPSEMNALRQKWLPLNVGNSEPGNHKVELTQLEKAWLEVAPPVRFCVDPAWLPLEYINPETGEYEGIVADYLALLTESTGLEFKLRPTANWADSVRRVKEGKAVMLPAVSKTAAREEFLNFSLPYINLSTVAIMRADAPFISDIKELEGKRVGVSKGTSIHQYLKKNYPNLRLVSNQGALNGLKRLDDGEIDAYIGSIDVLGYLINQNQLYNLKVALKISVSRQLHMAVNKNAPPELIGILNKGIKGISEAESNKIKSRWINLQVHERVDFSLLWKIGLGVSGLAVLIVSIIMWWNRKLAKEIAEHQLTERKLAESERKSRAMSEAVHDGLILIDSKAVVLFWNPAAEEIFGYSADEAIGKNMHNLFVPDEWRGAAERGMRRFATTGKGAILGRMVEQTARRKDGSEFPVEVSVASFQVDHEWFAVGTVRDISKRKETEQQVRNVREELQQIFDNSQVGVMYLKGGRVLHRANQRMAEILGYDSPDEMIGFSMMQLHLDEKKFKEFGEQHFNTLASGQQIQVEYQLRRRKRVAGVVYPIRQGYGPFHPARPRQGGHLGGGRHNQAQAGGKRLAPVGRGFPHHCRLHLRLGGMAGY